MEEKAKIKSFTDLETWREGHKLVLMIYEASKTFPKEETYSLTDQIKRCSISITSNIAEGFSRRGKKEKLQFFFMAKGSLTEFQNQLLVAKDVGYISSVNFDRIAQQSVTVHKLLNGLIKGTQSRP